ncbi:MAG: HEAT repeat domain-containing protein [Candidatus Jordarchaeales archaeon]
MKETLFEKLGILLLNGKEEEALDLLKTLMCDEDPEVKVASLAVISTLMQRFRRVVEGVLPLVLRAALTDQQTYVRGNALEVLGKAACYTPNAVVDSLPEVISCINSQDSNLAWNAVVTLGWIGGSNPKIVEPFMEEIAKNLDSEHEIARGASAMAMGWIGGVRPDLVKKYVLKLVKVATSDEKEEVRLNAMDALASISHADATLLKGFLKNIALASITDENENVRGSALEAITGFCKRFPDASAEVVLSILDNVFENRDVNWKAIATIGFLGAGNPDAIPYILNTLTGQLGNLKGAARATAILAVGWVLGNNPGFPTREAEKVINFLVRFLKDEDSKVRESVIEAIGWISANSHALLKKYLPVVLNVLRDERDSAVKRKSEEVAELMSKRLLDYEAKS